MARLLVLVFLWCSSVALAAPALPLAPPIAARSYVLVDALSGRTLAAAGENEPVEPASLTKLMTAYLVFEAIRDGQLTLEKQVNASAVASGLSK